MRNQRQTHLKRLQCGQATKVWANLLILGQQAFQMRVPEESTLIRDITRPDKRRYLLNRVSGGKLERIVSSIVETILRHHRNGRFHHWCARLDCTRSHLFGMTSFALTLLES